MIHPEYVAAVIDKLATDDAIFTVDTGMSAVWAARYLGGKRDRYMTGSFNHGSMANAMPMALGAALQQPKPASHRHVRRWRAQPCCWAIS